MQYGNWKLPWAWDFIIKYLNPALLAALVVNGIFNDATDTEGGFYNYPGWVQAVGIMTVAFLLLVAFILAIYPSLWTLIAGSETEEGLQGLDDPMSSGTSHSDVKDPLTQEQQRPSTDAV